MIENIWDFITIQFAFSQAGVSQSWLFWFIIAPSITWKLTKDHYKKRYTTGGNK